ncbi:uncharacterized protein LAESUDRAFT_762144 [Laetiporus sulphureus 93-53]|uniref:Uncharacterized protein n=1 Tax=Laetiporus sulphureus 93-53 TaxID=1314785 RepID=A0A165CNZ9_9APHY|nr:uncharacterized protein LAESUDRAFT_762144 [Laetiporus sulphureus 93-53]KZT03155.1 hypothetical protein LAESUDRAFT_762144 [Laetiporus sulphureus 93-53]
MEASACTPSDTGKVAASDSPTAFTGIDDALLSVALTSFSAVAMPVTASAALGDPVPKFEFQARVANPVTIDPPSSSNIAAMEVDPPFATMFDKPPSAQGSEIIELSSNDEDNSDSDEVEFMGGTISNLSPAHPNKGKGHGCKSIKASKMTTTSEDQVSPGLAEAIYHLLEAVPSEGMATAQDARCQGDCEGSSYQVDYNKQMRDANTASSDYAAELELPLDTPIDEYETTIALTPCLRLVHTLPDTPKPDVKFDTEGHFDRPPKCPRFNSSDPDDIMTQHTHAGTIVILSTKVLKLHSSKGKSCAKGSSKAATVKSELIRASTAIIEPSAASTQLK